MAIKEVLELIGDDVVIKKLENVKKAGEESLAVLNKPLPDLKFPTVDATPAAEVTDHVVKLKDALHTLKPILQVAGLQISEFGAFARLASGSVVGLAVALGGAVLVGLAKLEENAARTKGILTDLLGSPDKGSQAFAILEKQAAQFGTTVEGLAPGLESFQQALNNIDRTAQGFRALREQDLPGAQLAKNAGAVTEAYGNFIKLLRAGRLTQDDAEKSAKAFFDAIKDGGVVTSAALKALPTGTINELKDAFGQAGLSTKQFFALVDTGAISVDNFEKRLINFGPQAQKAFDTKSITSFSDELNKTFAVLKEGFKSLTGTELSDFLNNEIKLFREGLRGFLLDLQNIRNFVRSGLVAVLGEPAAKTSTQGFDEAGFKELADTVEKLPPTFISASNSLQKLGAAGLIAGNQVSQSMEQASASIQNLRDKAKETGKEMDDIVIGSTRFKGRLDQIPVFEPQLAGEGGAQAAKAAEQIRKTFIENPLFKEGVTVPVKPVLDQEAANTLFKDIKPTIPAEAQENIVNEFKNTGAQSGQAFSAEFATTVPQTFGLFQSLWQQIVSLFATPIPVVLQGEFRNPLQSTGPFASGGMVRGPGSSTSDSILAWLSNREFVVNAKAVSHYGPDFFAALNAMRLPQNFNMGGMARMMAGNKFAGGGMVKGNPVVLNIDRKSFNMSAGDDTITQLKRFAVASQLSSTGRKPRWVK